MAPTAARVKSFLTRQAVFFFEAIGGGFFKRCHPGKGVRFREEFMFGGKRRHQGAD